VAAAPIAEVCPARTKSRFEQKVTKQTKGKAKAVHQNSFPYLLRLLRFLDVKSVFFSFLEG
jgi:hypothetical protein